jgi:hypothetical protein
LKVGVGVLGAIAVIASDGFLAPLVASLVGGEAGRRVAGRFVPDRETEQSRRDASIDANRTVVDTALRTWRDAIRGELEAESKALTRPAVQHLEELRHRIERYAEWVALLRRAARDLSDATANLTDGG